MELKHMVTVSMAERVIRGCIDSWHRVGDEPIKVSGQFFMELMNTPCFCS